MEIPFIRWSRTFVIVEVDRDERVKRISMRENTLPTSPQAFDCINEAHK